MAGELRVFKGRPVVPGRAVGEALVVDSISFYGDVDPSTGRLHDGRSVAGRIVIAGRSRGSTVGPYVLYSLKWRKLEPRAVLLASRSDPVLVAGAVLAEVVLVDSLPPEILSVRDGARVSVDENGLIRVES